MINLEKPFNIHDYVEITLRRKWYLVIPFVVILAGAIVYTIRAPKEYRATTLILVTPQKVPEQFIRPTVTSRIEDRLQSISQEIMSRTRLEQVISEFKLYPEEVKGLSAEEVVELMRKNVQVEIKGKEGYFTVSYVGKDPRTVTQVTNKLASLFIEENLKLREQQAQGTTEFLSIELKGTRERLEDQEKAVTQFKRQHFGELPEQRDANLRVFEQLQNLYQRVNESLRAAQDRRVVIQKQLSDIQLAMTSLSANRIEVVPKEPKEGTAEPDVASLINPLLSPIPVVPPLRLQPQPRPAPKTVVKSPQEVQLDQLKGTLLDLQAKYTEKHPDIRVTKRRIAELEEKVETIKQERETEEKKLEQAREAEQREMEAKLGEAQQKNGVPIRESRKEEKVDTVRFEVLNLQGHTLEIESQLAATDKEIERLKEEEGKIKAQMAHYRQRVENTPIREQDMTRLSRDYQSTRDSYQALVKKSEEAQQAENLERRQKGEQFKVLDPARLPEKPFRPNIPRILLLGFLLGLGAGGAAVFIREQIDRSFQDADDLEAALGVRVLANIPKIKGQRVAHGG